MKNKQLYWTRASFGLLFFVFLGYVIKFYLETIASLDSSLQTGLRGNLPDFATAFFRVITLIGNTEIQVALVILAAALLYFGKNWKAEAGLVALDGSLAALLIIFLKNVYRRDRPDLNHLVEAHGFSFPSGHSLGSMLILGSLIIIVHQRMQPGLVKRLTQGFLGLLILLIGLSRIYLGVHYPTDVMAGFALGWAVLNLIYPSYDQKRFELRFQGKQK